MLGGYRIGRDLRQVTEHTGILIEARNLISSALTRLWLLGGRRCQMAADAVGDQGKPGLRGEKLRVINEAVAQPVQRRPQHRIGEAGAIDRRAGQLL
jgi:hypothetical protein